MPGFLLESVKSEARELVRDSMSTAGPSLTAEEVHSHRITTKKLRSFWIAVRAAIGREACRTSVDRLRSAARLMAAARDSHVRGKTIERLRSVAGRAQRRALDRVASDLARATNDAVSDPGPDAVREFLTYMDEEWMSWAVVAPQRYVEADDLIMGQGIGRTYRKARGFASDAAILRTAAGYHRLRRWVKYHRYQLEWLVSIGFAGLEPKKGQFEDLGRDLGRLNDLHVLYDFVETHSTHIRDPRDLAPVVALLRRESTRLAERSLRQSRTVMEESPGGYVARLERALDQRIKGDRCREPSLARAAPNAVSGDVAATEDVAAV